MLLHKLEKLQLNVGNKLFDFIFFLFISRKILIIGGGDEDVLCNIKCHVGERGVGKNCQIFVT